MPLFVTARLLEAADVVHGFTGREGGVSRGAFASLNLGLGVGDQPEAVSENFARLGAAARVERFATASQVHGDRVLGASLGEPLRELLPESAPEQVEQVEQATRTLQAPQASRAANRADALVALQPGVAVAIRVADCVPILLYAEDRGTAAAVHSGWRGARLGIAGRCVRALEQATSARPERILAAIGPCIGRCCYQVSPDLAQLFRGLFGEDVADDPAGPRKPHLDLRACVERSLRAALVPAARIEQVGGCTSCDAAYFSHRRDRGTTGRQVGFIAARQPAHI